MISSEQLPPKLDRRADQQRGSSETTRRDGILLAGRIGESAPELGGMRRPSEKLKDTNAGAGRRQEEVARNHHRQFCGSSSGWADC